MAENYGFLDSKQFYGLPARRLAFARIVGIFQFVCLSLSTSSFPHFHSHSSIFSISRSLVINILKHFILLDLDGIIYK
jgi:hypothetical protein